MNGAERGMRWRRWVATALDVPLQAYDWVACPLTRGWACPYRLVNGRPHLVRLALWWIVDHSAFWKDAPAPLPPEQRS